ncbi:hypothetical protein ACFRDV_26625 [Streptomyces fagopyri]|uniref:hypothetical protein n=1 Tax=Streptomyces fagopyri TaxID=2662397 RepID=UPI003685F080
MDGTPAADIADHTITLQNRTGSRIWVGSEVNADGSTAIAGLPTLDPGQSATIRASRARGRRAPARHLLSPSGVRW